MLLEEKLIERRAFHFVDLLHFYIGHAAVTDFKVGFVENFVLPMCKRKMHVNQFHNVFSYVY